MPRVTIVEDHLLLAEALTIALHQHDVAAVAIAPRRDLLAGVLATSPDLVLLDLDLGPYGAGEELVAPLTDRGIPVLVVSGVTDRWRVAAALEAGAVGYAPKANGFDALLTAALNVLSGSTADGEAGRHELLAGLARYRADRARALRVFAALTDRERATLRELAEGYQVREIATRWVVSEATVRTHVRGVLSKLGVGTQLAAVALARRSGWLDESSPPAEILSAG